MSSVPQYTASQRMIAAATRLKEAWQLSNVDIGEMHEAALGLIHVTGTPDLQSALHILHDVESDHDLGPTDQRTATAVTEMLGPAGL